MSRPRSLRIGAHKWRVLWSKSAVARHLHGQDDAGGTCSVEFLEIAVVPLANKNVERGVLLHEILHACVESSQPDIDYDTEERFVASITAPLLDALRSNPSLTKYLLEP